MGPSRMHNLPVKVLSRILLITTVCIFFSIDSHASSSNVSTSYPGGVTYNGEVNSSGIPHGKGTVAWADGSHYTGDLLPRIASVADSAKVHYNMGVEYASEGKFIQAREEFKVTMKMDPSLIPSQFSLKVIEGAIALHFKKEAVMHNFKGVAFGYKGMVEKSITEYTKAIEIDPKIAATYNNRGDAYINQGHYDRAISDFTKAIEIDPEHAIAYTNRGNAYNDTGHSDRAISDFTKAIEIDPEYSLAYTNRGYVYMMSVDDITMACKDFKRACELGNCMNYNISKKGGHCR